MKPNVAWRGTKYVGPYLERKSWAPITPAKFPKPFTPMTRARFPGAGDMVRIRGLNYCCSELLGLPGVLPLSQAMVKEGVI